MIPFLATVVAPFQYTHRCNCLATDRGETMSRLRSRAPIKWFLNPLTLCAALLVLPTVLSCALGASDKGIADKPAVTITRVDNTFEFRIGEVLVTTYHIDPKYAKPFFWPLNAPSG